MEPAMRGAVVMGGMPISVIIITVIGIALVGTIVFLIIRNSRMKKNILKERLAKGEISQEEYKNLLNLIQK